MKIFLITIAVFLIAVLLMAIGVLLGRKPLRGSCAAARENLGLECAGGCKKPCFKRRMRDFLKSHSSHS